MTFLYHDICNLVPLICSWVDTSRVMCTCVQQEHRFLRCFFQSRDEAIEVEPDSFGVEIRVVYWLDANVTENRVMVSYVRSDR